MILNGLRIVIFHYSQNSTDKPIVDLQIESVAQIAAQLASLLSPAAIRRDCSPPVVDLSLPLAPGFRSSARISKGLISYLDYGWSANIPLPQAAQQNLDETGRVLLGYRPTVTGGRVWREESSRVRAHLEWAMPHHDVLKFAQDKKLTEIEYVSLDTAISSNPARPTVFDIIGSVNIVAGEPLFRLARWETRFAETDSSMNYRGQAFGHIADRRFEGQLEAEYESTFPAVPNLRINMFIVGKFEITLEPN